jgi:hypothetical protein
MKLGTSLSRCVRDIFEKRVDFNQVMVVVARTDFDPEDDNQWAGIWKGYAGDDSGSIWSHPEWHGYKNNEKDFREICISLKKSGKLHQPRQFGAFPTRMDEYWYDLVLTADVVDGNPAAKKAWENYKLIAGLVQDA